MTYRGSWKAFHQCGLREMDGLEGMNVAGLHRYVRRVFEKYHMLLYMFHATDFCVDFIF